MNQNFSPANRNSVAGLCAVLAVCLCVLPTSAARAGSLPPIQTVFIILLENNSWATIKGNLSAPYINSLLPLAAHCEQYTSTLHPSLPNYIWLEGGTNFSITTDNPPSASNHVSSALHLTTLLNQAGISWKGYMEGIPGTNVPLQDISGTGYAVRHDPFAYFDDITGTNNPNYAYGIAHLRPYSEMATNLATGNVARYNFITPNVCDDMHDTCGPLSNSILQGDVWLSNNIPIITNSLAYKNGGAIFITWDECGAYGPQIGMIILSPYARAGYSNSTNYTHSSTVRTMQEIFGVTPLLGDAANATDLSDLFFIPLPPLNGLQITNFTTSPTGIKLTATGVNAGKTNLVECSTNLLNWTIVATNVPTTNSFTYTNTAPTNAPRQFYRVVQLP